MKPHPQQSEILSWAAEWSRHCAILFYHTTQPGDSDIRVDFNEGYSTIKYWLRTAYKSIKMKHMLQIQIYIEAVNISQITAENALWSYWVSVCGS